MSSADLDLSFENVTFGDDDSTNNQDIEQQDKQETAGRVVLDRDHQQQSASSTQRVNPSTSPYGYNNNNNNSRRKSSTGVPAPVYRKKSAASTPPMVNAGDQGNTGLPPVNKQHVSYQIQSENKTNSPTAASTGQQQNKWDVENAVIVGGLKSGFDLKALFELLEKECGKIKASTVKGEDKILFQFADQEAFDKATQKVSSLQFDGSSLKLLEKTSSKPNSPVSVSPTTLPSPPAAGSDPAAQGAEDEVSPTVNTTLVLKNLPFHIKHDKLHEILTKLCGFSSKYVRYHQDAQGAFRGIAFVKYRTLEEAVAAFGIINNADIMGRKIRCEYKKKGSSKSKDKVAKAQTPTNTPKDASTDMNYEDPETRDIYFQILGFKEDSSQVEMSYPPTLNVTQRKSVIKICEKLSLVCTAKGDSLNVRKNSTGPAPASNNNGAKTKSTEVQPARKTSAATSPLNSSGLAIHMERRSSNSSSSYNAGNLPPALSTSPALSSSLERNRSSSLGTSPIIFRNPGSLKGQSVGIPVTNAKGPDGNRGFAAGRGKPLTPTTSPVASQPQHQ